MDKKIMMVGAAALMLMLGSCSNDKKSTSEATETTPTEAVAETPVEAEPTPADKNLAAGAEYLANLQKSDETVKVTESGLGYKVLKEGKGANPVKTSDVKVNYTGKHIDGTVFDSSNGTPIEFNLGQVIPGFTEGLMLMNKGAKYEIYIPGNLAYGPRGVAQAGIGPNEMLVFEIELIDFK